MNYRDLSNSINAAAETGNVAALHELDANIATALANGSINLPQAGELTADCELALDSLSRNDYMDDVYAAVRLDGGI